ncbi:aldehyde dehydrogenase family protein [Amycolatopsis jejuensis]|uniref:aldehyde dehydrogenase family protein n=1 Tax=Amycolatopsis jejuensis TaxID=330084 RepID=UPI000524F69A|nr:aldehyde dehydrogenase family protein [Amycolatopsis jejuensis]
MQHVPLIINGDEIAEGADGQAETFDPATGEVIATFALAGAGQADLAVEAARETFDTGVWRKLRPVERGRVLAHAGRLLSARREELARLLTLDSGKPLRDSYYEVDCSARFFEFYGGYADKVQGKSIPLGPEWMDWTIQEPIGVSLQVVPWNYQLLVAVRGIAPALAAGCSVVVKPSSETPQAMREFAGILREAGLPDGVLNVVTGRGRTVGDHLVRHRGIDQVTFTGSVNAGIKVLQAAATHTIPTVMELGGKSPQIVFADADLSATADVLIGGMYTHAGQVCNAGTRLLVEESVHDDLVARLHAKISAMRLGHGLEDPDMGPVVSAAQKTDVTQYYDVAAEEGKLLLGAELPDDGRLCGGNFVRPGIVTGLGNSSRLAQEEIFGPLLTVIPFRTADEAFTLANDSDFGLVAGVFTQDVSLTMQAARELQVGQVYVNSFGVGLDVEFPFGGYKRSGFGREKGLEAIEAYLQVKNVCVRY